MTHPRVAWLLSCLVALTVGFVVGARAPRPEPAQAAERRFVVGEITTVRYRIKFDEAGDILRIERLKPTP